jgi:hypothetical protein
MKAIACLLGVVLALTGSVIYLAHASQDADAAAAPLYGIKIPAGYRDWRLISVAHEEGNNNDLRAVLGNDVAIKAYREGKLPFPDGTIIARLAWSYVSSEENNKVFGRAQSFVAGAPLTFSLCSRTQKNTRRPAAGDSLSLRTANLPTKHCSGLAFLATSLQKLRTSCSLTTHPHPDPSTSSRQGIPETIPCRSRTSAAPNRDGCAVLRTDNHFNPPVQLPTARLGVAGDRVGFAVALSPNTRRTDAARHELISHRIRTVLG